MDGKNNIDGMNISYYKYVCTNLYLLVHMEAVVTLSQFEEC